MNNVFVYCELEGTVVAEVSLELLTKGKETDLLGIIIFLFTIVSLVLCYFQLCVHGPYDVTDPALGGV